MEKVKVLVTVGATEINVIGTLPTLEADRREGVRKIFTASSAGILDKLRVLPIKEDHPTEA